LDGERRTALAALLRLQATGCDGLGAPFYAALLEHLAVDAEQDGDGAAVLAPYADAQFVDAYPLRLLGGVHRMVLAGDAPALAAHYASVGGDGDADAAHAPFLALLAARPPAVLDALTRPPQTNEVGRAAALVSGLLVVAARTGLPVRIREVGSSGGLNLRVDAYWYGDGDRGWGEPSSPVRFVDQWDGGEPPFGAPLKIVDRRGCDRDPVDVTADDGGLTLLSYVWPQPPERFMRARAAMELARGRPVAIDRADVVDWLPAQLEAVPGTACVAMHSVVWQYLSEDARAAILGALEAAGAAATPDAPVAWLRLEPNDDTYYPAELRLDLWDGRGERTSTLLATSGFHGGRMEWRGLT
jgi:hypothetical protein